MIGPAGFVAAPKASEPENKRLDEIKGKARRKVSSMYLLLTS